MSKEPYHVLIKEEIYEKIARFAEKTHRDVPDAIHFLIETASKAQKEAELPAPIEFEQVTIRLPKPIMAFLRQTDCDNQGPENWIEYVVVDAVNAYLDDVEPREMIDWFKLGPTFHSILGDKNYARASEEATVGGETP